jgi:hypothetical protein
VHQVGWLRAGGVSIGVAACPCSYSCSTRLHSEMAQTGQYKHFSHCATCDVLKPVLFDSFQSPRLLREVDWLIFIAVSMEKVKMTSLQRWTASSSRCITILPNDSNYVAVNIAWYPRRLELPHASYYVEVDNFHTVHNSTYNNVYIMLVHTICAYHIIYTKLVSYVLFGNRKCWTTKGFMT